MPVFLFPLDTRETLGMTPKAVTMRARVTIGIIFLNNAREIAAGDDKISPTCDIG
jgi:hypothetical protein